MRRTTPWDENAARMHVLVFAVSPLILWRIVHEFVGAGEVFGRGILVAGWSSVIAWMLLVPILSLRRRMRRSGWDRDRFLMAIGVPTDVASVARECIIAVPMLLLVVALMLGTTWVADLFAGRVARVAGSPTAWHGVEDSAARWLGGIVLVTIGPWAEELFYRGFLYSSFKSRFGSFAALAGQAGLFAFMHAHDMRYMLTLVTLSVALVGVYRWRRMLLAPVVVHGLLNALVLAGALVGTRDAEPWIGVEGPVGGEACVVVGITDKSPAAEAGIEVGDVIVSVDGERIESFLALQRAIRARRVGDRIRIGVDRGGVIVVLEVVVGPKHGR